VKQSMGQRTWAAAIGEVRRSVVRHKIVSVIVALCVAGSLTAIALAGSASGQPAQPAHPAAPGFSLPVLGHPGQQVTISGYAGQPLIVNFFASWCEPCKKETPLLAAFYRSEHGTVAVVGLDENDVRASAMSFTRADGVTYPVGWDPVATAASAYGVSALPQTFFLDTRHRIVDRVFGPLTLADIHRGIALAEAG